MHAFQYISMVYPHIGHGFIILYTLASLQRASLARCLFVSVFGRERNNGFPITIIIIIRLIFHTTLSPRGVGFARLRVPLPDGSS
jgi:hypothetical protein